MASSYRNKLIEKYSQQYGVDPKWIQSIMQVESGGNAGAQSGAGAQGLMQVEPSTAAQYLRKGEKLTNPETNIRVGIQYFSDLLKQFHGDYRIATAAYNAGPGAVSHYKGIPPYPETQAYVRKVQSGYTPVTKSTSDDPLVGAHPQGAHPAPDPLVGAHPSGETPTPQTLPSHSSMSPADAAKGLGGAIQTGAANLANAGMQLGSMPGGLLNAVLGAPQRGVAGFANQTANDIRQGTMNPATEPLKQAGGALYGMFHPNDPSVESNFEQNTGVAPLIQGAGAGMPESSLLPLEAQMGASEGSLGPVMASALGTALGHTGSGLREGVARTAFQTATDPLTVASLPVKGGSLLERGGNEVLRNLEERSSEFLRTPQAPGSKGQTLQHMLASVVPDPDVHLGFTPRGRATVRGIHNSEAYKEAAQAKQDMELLKKYHGEIMNGAVPDEVRQRLLGEAWKFGTEDMRADAEKFGYKPTASDLKEYPKPEGVLNYPLRREYFPHVGQKRLETPEEVKSYAQSHLNNRPNDFAGFEKPQLSEEMPANPADAMEYRLQLGRLATRSRMAQKRIADETGLGHLDFNIPEDLVKQGVHVLPDAQQAAVNYMLMKPHYTAQLPAGMAAWGQGMQKLSNLQRSMLVSQSPLPHGKNISTLAGLVGGPRGVIKGLQFTLSGVPKDLEERLVQYGGAGANFAGSKGTKITNAIPWKGASNDALDRLDMGMRAARLAELDKKYGDKLSEYEKMQIVDDDLGAYRHSPAYVRLASQVLGAEFPQWHLHIVPTAVARAVLKNPQRIEALVRSEQNINDASGANQRGWQQGMGGPVDEFNSLLEAPFQIARGQMPSYLTSQSALGPVVGGLASTVGHEDPNFVGGLGRTTVESAVPYGREALTAAGDNPYNSKASTGERLLSQLTAMPIRSTSAADPGSYFNEIWQTAAKYNVDFNTAKNWVDQQNRAAMRELSH